MLHSPGVVVGNDTGGRTRRRARGVAVNATALRQARIDARLSLAQVAGTTVTKQAVHLFETGRARPTMATLRVIVERLGNISMEAALADATEHRLAELDEQRRHDELGRLDRQPARGVTLFRRARRLLLRVSERALAAEAMDWEAAGLYLLQDVTAVDVGLQALERY